MTGALAWLIVTSTRNQLVARVRRLRNPRYAAAMLIGIVYLWGVYFRPGSNRAEAQDILGPALVAVLPLLSLVFVAWTWITGQDRRALAFTRGEVAMLFPAPLTRRTLVLYRIARTQPPILATSIVWTLVFRQTPSVAAALAHVLGYWVMLATINMNRLGVALVHAGAEDHGVRGARRNALAIATFATLFGLVLVPVALAWPAVRQADGVRAALEVLSAVTWQAPARWALYPFRALVAPLAAPIGLPWLRAMGPALVLLAALTAWVLRTETAFEEMAVEASEDLARRTEALRGRRRAAPLATRHLSRTLPLAPTGPPAVALLWKNAMWLLRANEVRGLYAPPAIALVLAAVLAPRSEVAAIMIAAMCTALGVMMLLVGPLATRNDLRSDLLHLGVIKTFPLRGRHIVLAEVASGALPIAGMQFLLGLAVLLALSVSPIAHVPAGVRAASLLAAPLPLLALNGATFILHNGLALLFPGWVRLGGQAGGVENLGFGMISLAFVILSLGLLLVAPAIAGGAVFFILRGQLPAAIIASALVGGLVLASEVVGCAWALGGAMERVEPMAVAP